MSILLQLYKTNKRVTELDEQKTMAIEIFSKNQWSTLCREN